MCVHVAERPCNFILYHLVSAGRFQNQLDLREISRNPTLLSDQSPPGLSDSRAGGEKDELHRQMRICSCEKTIIAVWFLACRNNQFNRNRERENMATVLDCLERIQNLFNLEPQCFLISTIQLMQKLIHTYLCLRTHLQDDKLVFMILYYFGCEIVYVPYIQHSLYYCNSK